jgi:hypothetical protein
MNAFGKLALVATLVAGLSVQAFARTQPASSGRAVNFGDIGCFGMWYGSMTNNCSYTASFDWPMVTDNGGAKTTTVTAYAAGAGNLVSCAEFALNREVTSFWGGTYVNIPSWGTASWNLTGANVPSGGYGYVNCSVANGGRINVINYNP